MSGWAAKQAKKAEWAEARKLDGLDATHKEVNDTRDAAMGKGEDQLFEKKLSKEEQKLEKERKKAEAKARRDAKKAAKGKPLSKKKSKENLAKLAEQEAALAARVDESEADRLAREEHIIATFASQKEQHAHAKDISVRDVTISFHGANLIENTDFALNYGNRYGFIGPNGSGKSTIMKAIAARCLPIPESIDLFFLDQEYPATDTPALDAVFEVDDERKALVLTQRLFRAFPNFKLRRRRRRGGVASRRHRRATVSIHAGADERHLRLRRGLRVGPRLWQLWPAAVQHVRVDGAAALPGLCDEGHGSGPRRRLESEICVYRGRVE